MQNTTTHPTLKSTMSKLQRQYRFCQILIFLQALNLNQVFKYNCTKKLCVFFVKEQRKVTQKFWNESASFLGQKGNGSNFWRLCDLQTQSSSLEWVRMGKKLNTWQTKALCKAHVPTCNRLVYQFYYFLLLRRRNLKAQLIFSCKKRRRTHAP